MTKQEKIREEIRLLGLRVDELKSQNKAYAEDNKEAERAVEASTRELESLGEALASLNGLKRDLEVEASSLRENLTRNKKLLSEVQGKIQAGEGRVRELEGEERNLRSNLDSLTAKIEEAELRLTTLQEDLSVKTDSLKAFEEQLIIREGLLTRREETITLREKGVKLVSEVV